MKPSARDWSAYAATCMSGFWLVPYQSRWPKSRVVKKWVNRARRLEMRDHKRWLGRHDRWAVEGDVRPI